MSVRTRYPASEKTGAHAQKSHDEYVAFSPNTRLLIGVVPGRRTLKSCVTLVQAVKDKTNDRTDMFFTTDEHSPYKTAIDKVYQAPSESPKRNGEDNSTKTENKLPADLCYATVRKTRQHGRVIEEEWVTYPMLLHSQ